MQKLYEIAEQIRNLEELIQDVTLPQELIKQAMDTVEGDLNTKVEGMCKYIVELENEVMGIKNEIGRLSVKGQSKANTVKSIKNYMFETLRGLNMEKVKTPLFNVGIQKNQKALKILDETKIPMVYVVPQELKFDRKAILADIKDGKLIEGVEVTQSESLRIR